VCKSVATLRLLESKGKWSGSERKLKKSTRQKDLRICSSFLGVGTPCVCKCGIARLVTSGNILTKKGQRKKIVAKNAFYETRGWAVKNTRKKAAGFSPAVT